MDHQIPALIFLPFLSTYLSIRIYWAIRAEKKTVQESRSFLFDKINIALQNLFLLLFPLLSFFTNFLDRFSYKPNLNLVLLSVPFLLSGLVIVTLAHRDLNDNWSVTLELKKDHSLITHGIFKSIRHPMYLSIWLCCVGQALCIPNYLSGAGILLGWAVLYFARIDKEEQMMLDKFGNEYATYLSRTKRLLPGIL